MERITREEYYFRVVEAVASRATCDRGRSGAILVKDQRIIAAGYVGSPSGTLHCDEADHELVKRWDQESTLFTNHCERTIHAEMNALIQCARYGPPCDGAAMYSTMFPCYTCAKSLVNAGIREVYALFDYQKSERSKQLFDEVGIKWVIKNEKVMQYPSA